MADEQLLDDAAAIADRRATSMRSTSEGIRLLDRIGRIFGAPAREQVDTRASSLFLWGPLEVRRALGAGSFGEVFAAWDPTLHREVALKLRSPETGALRWLDEARHLARVRHPNVLTVHGADVLDGRAGIWTELIVGKTLEEELQASGPFSEAETLRIGRDIASALAAVHAAGLVHGDVKTSNIMLQDGETPRRALLVDFGSADRQQLESDMPAYLVGTPLTMAPEVLEGHAATGASDVYGLGVTLFRLLAGRHPVEAESLEELKRAHESGEQRRVRAAAPHVSARLSRALERALEPDPARRWPDARSFRRALEDVADPSRRIRARAAAIGAAAAATAAIVVIGILIARPGPGPLTRAALSAPSNPDILTESWRTVGTASHVGWGWAVAVLDIDGDGFDDIAASEAHWSDSDGVVRGRIVVYCGSPNGPSTKPAFEIVGDRADVESAAAMASAGDVNSDGFDDLLVKDRSTGTLQTAPRVRLYLGAPRGNAPVLAWEIVGASYITDLGNALTGAGDVNNDGYDDVLISEAGAKDRFDTEGLVYLYLGCATGLARDPAWKAAGGQAGARLAGWLHPAGDVNNDGFDDVLLGVPVWDGAAVDCGQARLYLGNERGASAEPVWSFDGAGANSHLSTMVSGAGDVNHDGYADIAISEPQYSDVNRPERGRALLFLGGPKGPSPTPDWQALGAVSYMHFGFNVIGIGDLDGDGFGDIAVGASQYTDGKRVHLGAAEVYRGGRLGCEANVTWRAVGDRDDAHLGQFLWSGDFNHDRTPDLVLSAPIWGDSLLERGLLVTYLGQRPSN